MDETVIAPETGSLSDTEAAGQAAARKLARKSLEELLAENQAEQKKILEKIRKRDKEARVQYEKDLWALLTAEKFDEVPMEVWRNAVPAIAQALKSAA